MKHVNIPTLKYNIFKLLCAIDVMLINPDGDKVKAVSTYPVQKNHQGIETVFGPNQLLQAVYQELRPHY